MKPFSNFKEYIFNRLFPAYYKKNDTYKDENGQGILERFIGVCSQYLDNKVMGDQEDLPGLHNIWDIIDIDKTPEQFLNYFWEYFGMIPYANLESKNNSELDLPKADIRRALKYAVSLYKIRGTQLFYTILGRLYGVEITISQEVKDIDRYGDEIEREVASKYNNISSKYGRAVTYKATKATYTKYDCNSCVGIEGTIGLDDETYQRYQDDADAAIKFLEAMVKVIQKYLPIYVKITSEDLLFVRKDLLSNFALGIVSDGVGGGDGQWLASQFTEGDGSYSPEQNVSVVELVNFSYRKNCISNSIDSDQNTLFKANIYAEEDSNRTKAFKYKVQIMVGAGMVNSSTPRDEKFPMSVRIYEYLPSWLSQVSSGIREELASKGYFTLVADRDGNDPDYHPEGVPSAYRVKVTEDNVLVNSGVWTIFTYTITTLSKAIQVTLLDTGTAMTDRTNVILVRSVIGEVSKVQTGVL